MIWEVTKQEDGAFIGRRFIKTPEGVGTTFEVVRPGGHFFGIKYEDLRETRSAHPRSAPSRIAGNRVENECSEN